MPRRPNMSRQTRLVLAALAQSPERWWYGYDLARQLGLKSGTLYPLLIRLHEQGLLEAEWRAGEAPGRPPRHMYRLTAAGAALAVEARSERSGGTAAPAALRPAG